MDGQVMETKYSKGAEGEKRITEALIKLGYKIIFVGGAVKFTIDGNRFFCSDLLSYKNGKSFWIQVKYKEPRKFYPDTGLETWRYKRLLIHQKETGLPLILLFTDNSQRIYGEWLNNLLDCVSLKGSLHNSIDNTEMIYFLLEKLKDYKKLL